MPSTNVMIRSTTTEILLVEDNPCDAELTLNTLRKHQLGSSVTHVTDGQQALDWLFGTGVVAPDSLPKLVLLDLKLPKVNGHEVLRAIRSDTRTRLLPVVVMSSSNQDRDVVESYGLGANSYVVKSLDFDSFSTAVAELGHYWLQLNEDPLKCMHQ